MRPSLKPFLVGLILAAAHSTFANEPSAQVLSQSAESVFYKLQSIPYPIRFHKKNNCNFSEREIRLIRETFDALPPVYSSINNDFFFDKECDIDPSTDSKDEGDLGRNRVHLASSYSGYSGFSNKIVFSDRTFSLVRDGKIYQLNEVFSKKIIAHELTHQLDDTLGFSKSDSFREINSWSRTLGILTSDTNSAEGFYREQGQDSAKEDLSTQAEGFFFDSDFICKHPKSYVWFYYWVGPSRVQPADCPEEMNSPIDPRKVKSVGFMLISATTESAESRFGHAALHFHSNPAHPFEDVVIEAGGTIAGAPTLTGFETQSELEQKQEYAKNFRVSNLEFYFKGATGQLELKVSPIKYQLKWLETISVEGRDISERILALTRLQIRVLAYIINKDTRRLNQNYNILSKNCSSYLARTINQAIGDDVAETTMIGMFTPKSVYQSLSSVLDRDLPVSEGNKTRLERLLPGRKNAIDALKKNSPFESLDFNALQNPSAQVEKTLNALNQILIIAKANAGKIGLEEQKLLRGLLYTFTVEESLRVQNVAVSVYKQVFSLFQ
ncbi:MAG: DUF4105 domain-containing protein [Bdellovibrionota bacterium]